MKLPMAGTKKPTDGRISPQRKGVQITAFKHAEKKLGKVESARTRNINKLHRVKVSPKGWVDGFSGSAEKAAATAAEIKNGLHKSLAAGDIEPYTTVAALKSSLGFWEAAAKYALRLVEERKNR